MAANTSAEAVRLLQQAIDLAKQAETMIKNLTVEHDYQDVAELLARSSHQLLNAGVELMQSNEEAALDSMEAAEDTIEEIYAIIESEAGDDDE